MTASPFNMFSPFSQSIGRFLYDPVTSWQGAFSPSFVFNNNPQDAPIEAHVLAEVGSYGKQLGVLIRVVDLLQKTVDRAGLGEEQLAALKAFETLRDEATEAAKEFRSRVSAEDILDLARAFSANRTTFEKAALREDLDRALRK
jgi:hypothetical protein